MAEISWINYVVCNGISCICMPLFNTVSFNSEYCLYNMFCVVYFGYGYRHYTVSLSPSQKLSPNRGLAWSPHLSAELSPSMRMPYSSMLPCSILRVSFCFCVHTPPCNKREWFNQYANASKSQWTLVGPVNYSL